MFDDTCCQVPPVSLGIEDSDVIALPGLRTSRVALPVSIEPYVAHPWTHVNAQGFGCSW